METGRTAAYGGSLNRACVDDVRLKISQQKDLRVAPHDALLTGWDRHRVERNTVARTLDSAGNGTAHCCILRGVEKATSTPCEMNFLKKPWV